MSGSRLECQARPSEGDRLLTDPTIADAALRSALLALMPAEHALLPSRAAGVRWQLHEQARHVRPWLQALLTLPLAGDAPAPLGRACAQLRDLSQRPGRTFPGPCDSSVAPRWTALVEQPDRHRALRAFAAATLLALRQALRNGSVWLEPSLAFRQHNAMLIPEAEWATHHRRFTRSWGFRSMPRTTPLSSSPRWKRAWCPWRKPWKPASWRWMTAGYI